ncbi:hypothetical protein BGX21_009629 [Mortierella sp. AD011]|nr:hypothetical protein BGX21_009629 [Mortierella sp. AD011]
MTQLLDLAIVPGKHLGWFRLGMSLWDVIRLLRDQAALIPVVELKYSDEEPFAADIVLRLVSNGIELLFEPYSQRLRLIHVHDFSRLRLTYSGGEGLSLVFPIPAKHISTYQNSTDQNAELPIEFPDGNTPVASHMYIFPRPDRSDCSDWLTATTVSASTLARYIQDSGSPSHHGGRIGEGRPELERVIAKINTGALLQFVGANQSQKCLIQLNVTTPQDLLADLGSPGSIYYKEDDKMQIHSDTDDSSQIQQEDDGILGEMEDIGYDRTNRPAEGSQKPNDYFYNYFHLGIDVLFDGVTHRCKKIVLHTNVPGHFDFQSYKRCPFILHLPSSSTSFDSEYAKLPPVAPQRTYSPSPTSGSPQPQGFSGEPTKSGKKKNKGVSSATAANDVMDPNPSAYSSGESPSWSPNLLGSSPVPSLNYELNNLQQTPRSSAAATPTGGLTAISPETGITPDMTISMVMTFLESNSASSTDTSGAGIPNKKPVNFIRGSKTQNPFNSTFLYGTDGVVFEAMHNRHIATVILY